MLLILESSRADGGYLRHECRDSKQYPIFRNIFHAVRLLYRSQGIASSLEDSG